MHRPPNILSPALRDALRALVQTACVQLELIQAREEAALILRANDSRDILVDQRAEFSDPEEIVARQGSAWLELFRAGGAAVVAGDRVASLGKVPEAAAIHAIVDWLGAHHPGEQSWSSRELRLTGLAALCEPSRTAGMLAVPLPIRSPRHAALLLFRPEKAETRIWAGNPEKTIDRESGHLSPRQSFESWAETVHGRSPRWTSTELRCAADLASNLAVLIAAGEIGRLNQRLEHLATSDHLTGLWNRYRMEEAIDHQVSVAARYGRPCAVVMFDIDHFKQFNDTHGHDAGDEVLVQVAQAVSSQLRDSDYVSRWGGEEFMVLAADTVNEGASRLAERLRAAIEALAIKDYGRVTASFGVAVHRNGEQSRDMLKRADVALYSAKAGGRNRVATSAD
ncbi:GGDEF domain-containing protein [Alkalisalibacterium limincola]|uniref:GGDEF domain-containing protein n=1 Tax=Alkalisalibacterium limincola TaxID=2699169 RepID=UPI001C9C92A3|nr:sensor domain-containing diguanylate cyclase [Alkalisalibacterium limincola]